jgi:hypothetical protein
VVAPHLVVGPAIGGAQEDINKLEEVIVTGVMEGVERSKVPFAVGRVTSEDLVVSAIDPMRALQGKVAGVRIASTGSGLPGGSPEILLRGPTSINANGRGQGPLIIVDDVIMNVGSLAEQIVVLDDFVSPVNSVAFSPDGHYLIAGCDDGRIYVWSIE